MVPKLRFKEFCGEWITSTMDTLSEEITVGIANSATHAYREKGILMFRNQNIKPNFLDDKDIIYIDEKFEKKYKNKRLKPYDLLIARTGYPGTACVVPEKYKDCQTFTTLIVRLILDKVDPYYICQYINSPLGTKYINSTQIGGGQKNSGAGIIKKMPVSLPSLQEQTKIADFLSTVDDKMQNQQDKITHLENIKKGFMQKIFSRKIRFKDDGGEEFPEWEDKKLSDIGNIITGNTPSTHDCNNYGEEYLWCSPIDLGNKKYINNTNTKLSEIGFNKTRKIPKNSIMVTCIGSTIGKIGICTTEMSTNQQINSIVVDKNNYYEFVYYSIMYNFYKFLSYISVQAVPIINKSQFENLKIMLPCLKEQQKIADFLSSFDKKISTEKETLEHLKKLKKGLLQQMFV